MDSGRTRRRRFDVLARGEFHQRAEYRAHGVPIIVGAALALRSNANIVVVSVAADRERPRQIV
jgi:hypothetical protein